MWGLEATAEVHAHQRREPAARAGPQAQGIFCYGEHLHLKSQFGARRAGEEDIQADQ